MTPYLLDTNHCSLILKGDPRAVQWLHQHGETGVAISVTICGELFFMAHKSEQRAQNLRHIAHFLSLVTIYMLDTQVAEWYGTLKAALLERFGPRDKSRRRRARIETIGITENDLWIAATAQRYGCILVTSDRDFERIVEVTPLRLECWS
ncbi:MAG: type II toxin-antitoxin system VapC family toxin [Chloroflexaceae bacterium]|nr:type II toxin-antitoxin system VapC family toxin [Chloroflexaceae bacterium]